MAQGVAAMQRHFVIHSSNFLMLSLVLVHAVAIVTCFILPLPLIAQALLFVILVASAAYYVNRDARLRSGRSCVMLRLEDDRIELGYLNGEISSGMLQSGSVVTPYLVVLSIRAQGRYFNRNVLVMPDSMDAESFRRLRVALKWQAGFSA